MQAVCFDTPGEPAQVLMCREQPVPEPRHGEVRVRMLASPVNPSDLMFIRGQYTINAQCPAIPGFEGVGIVEKSGGGLRGRLFQGRRVAVLNGIGGNWAEHAVVPAERVIPLSRSLSLEQAASFFVNPATAWVMTQEVLKVRPGEFILQTAAASSLGLMIARLGVHRRFETINVVRRPEQAALLEAAGAQHTIIFDAERDAPDVLVSAVHAIAPDGVKHAIDAVSGPTASAAAMCLGHNGRLLLYGTLSGQPVTLDSRSLMSTAASVEGFWLGHFMQSVGLSFRLRLVRRLTALIRSGVLLSEPGATFPLTDIRQAVTAAEQQGRPGKVLLRMC